MLSPDQVSLIGLVFETYVMEHHKNDVLQIFQEASEDTHYPVVVNAMTLFEYNMEVGECFNAFPSQVLPIFDNALHRVAQTVSQTSSSPQGSFNLKHNLHVRISGKQVWEHPLFYTDCPVSGLNNEDFIHLLCIFLTSLTQHPITWVLRSVLEDSWENSFILMVLFGKASGAEIAHSTFIHLYYQGKIQEKILCVQNKSKSINTGINNNRTIIINTLLWL